MNAYLRRLADPWVWLTAALLGACAYAVDQVAGLGWAVAFSAAGVVAVGLAWPRR